MKKGKFVGTLLLLATVFTLVSVSALANDTDVTRAQVGFVDGELEFEGNTGTGGMNINFGLNHALPVGAQTYIPVDGNHSLTVRDAKSGADNWRVEGKVGDFVSTTPANTFQGTITFTNGTPDSGLVTPASPIDLVSGASGVLVMTGADTLVDDYATTWLEADIVLAFDAVNAATIVEPATYSADMTWTLISMP